MNSRKELLRLLEDVKNKKINRIVFWRLDRWFRNIQDYYKVNEILTRYNVDWECSDEEYNTTTTNGRLHLNIKLSIAQNESDTTADRIKFNFNNMVKDKRPIFGTNSLPIGYMVSGDGKNKRVVKNPEEVEVVNFMFDTFEETQSIRKTCIAITQKYTYRNFLYETISRTLQSTMYYGCYRDIENYCEPYITKERWDKIQSLRKHNLKNNSQYATYIFKGLIRCKRCGRIMTGNSSHSRHVDGSETILSYYRCARHTGNGSCNNEKVISQSKLERWLMNNFFLELSKYVELESIEDTTVEIKDNKKTIKKIEDKLSRLNELYIDGKISKEDYDVKYLKEKNELEILNNNNKLKSKKRDLSKYKNVLENKNALELYKQLDNEHKRQFWSNYIEYIEQDNENGFVIYFK